jgi:hypothetical protein
MQQFIQSSIGKLPKSFKKCLHRRRIHSGITRRHSCLCRRDRCPHRDNHNGRPRNSLCRPGHGGDHRAGGHDLKDGS